ncbi:Glutathione S-transferase [Parvularcula bermudensis HTCC2503]|uniref:Glutathione S-transferase n=1 Tax=Parvularcula bermudensis (strain ATCC BAA-594 / HTCC2503 / KCTC 12087) TaxID=314260 RepID=E0TBC3_PARBH|nr:glutathione S-transferase family protein [Parvularcula bermudensis]ADM08327.1 Glutathione S-transferase [Parvularcula bermudensis HTCC2503]
MALDFYTNPMSRGQIVRWMLEESGLPYEEKIVAYGPEMKGENYRQINPMGKVPAIVHEGRIVTECAAICVYLAEMAQEADLAPHPDERADYYRWIFFAAGPVEAAVTTRAMGFSPQPDQEVMAGFGNYDLTMSVLEGALSGRDYLCGARFTAADVYVGSQVDWGLTFGTIPSRPAFDTYAARLRDRPAYKRAKARDQALIEAQNQAQGPQN